LQSGMATRVCVVEGDVFSAMLQQPSV